MRSKIGAISLCIISLLSVCTTFIPTGTSETSHGNILYVGGTGPGNYTRIQDAIDNASNGDIVYIFPGTYYGYIIVNKSIQMIGENKTNTIIDGNGAGVVLQVTMPRVTIRSFTIRNASFTEEKDGVCIGIEILSNNNTLQDNIIEKLDYGINYGICLRHSSDNIIAQNTINGDLIYLHLSPSNTISKNIISGGIELYASNENTIAYNTITEYGYTGISLHGASNNTISNNIISNKSYTGIELSSATIILSIPDGSATGTAMSNSNIIYKNTIVNNSIGIHILESSDNIIYYNNFIDNALQAFDDSDNTWDNEILQQGNYWSDYIGIDANGDGIGDTPYNISEGNNQDSYPLMEAYPSANEIQGQFQVSTEKGTYNVGEEVNINLSFINPYHIEITCPPASFYLNITDSSGTIVYQIGAKINDMLHTIPANSEQMMYLYSWNQTDKNGNQVPQGKYTINVELIYADYEDETTITIIQPSRNNQPPEENLLYMEIVLIIVLITILSAILVLFWKQKRTK